MLPSIKRFSLEILKAIVIVCVAVLLIGWVYERFSSSRDQRKYPPPGRLVDVQGRKMHINATGSGPTTLVFDSDHGVNSTEWHAIQEQLKGDFRVVAYDRFGYGWSEPALGSRTAFDAAYELKQLLTSAGEKPPYILVGHGYGALTMQFFQSLYPDDVRALVLLDPLHEDLADSLPAPRLAAPARLWDHTTLFFAQAGLHRLMNRGKLAKTFGDLPAAAFDPLEAHYLRPQTLITAYHESLSLQESLRLMRDVRRSDQTLPLIVVSSGETPFLQKSPGQKELYNTIRDSHQKLASLSSNGQHRVIESSGHFIQHEQPEFIIQTLRAFK